MNLFGQSEENREKNKTGKELSSNDSLDKTVFQHPPIVMDLVMAFKQWYGIHQHLPKMYRITISTQMMRILSECIELGVMANFGKNNEEEWVRSMQRIIEIRGKIELLKAYALVSWEMKFISHGFYAQYTERLERLSKQASSWHKWFLQKIDKQKGE